MTNTKLIISLLTLLTYLGGCATTDVYRNLRDAIHGHPYDHAQALLQTYPNQISATDAVIVAAAEGDITAVDLFLPNGGQVPKRGQNPKNEQVTQGADINQRNAEGETALTLAVRQRNPQMVEYLVQHGADPSIRDGAGRTPLDYIRLWRPEDAALSDHKDMIAQYLTERSNGKKPTMGDIVQALPTQRHHRSDGANQPEETARVEDLHSSIIR